jgi:hypothetical protein
MHTPTHPGTHAHTHTDRYVIFIAFARQKLLCERASVLRYAYFAYLVSFSVVFRHKTSYTGKFVTGDNPPKSLTALPYVFHIRRSESNRLTVPRSDSRVSVIRHCSCSAAAYARYRLRERTVQARAYRIDE